MTGPTPTGPGPSGLGPIQHNEPPIGDAGDTKRTQQADSIREAAAGGLAAGPMSSQQMDVLSFAWKTHVGGKGELEKHVQTLNFAQAIGELRALEKENRALTLTSKEISTKGHMEVVRDVYRKRLGELYDEGARLVGWPPLPTRPTLEAASKLLERLEKRDGQGQSELYRAVNANDLPRVKALLALGVNVNQGDNEGRTPLMVAARFNRGPMIPLLAKAGAHLDGKDTKQCTALFHACQNNSVNAANALLAAGAQVDTPGEGNQTALTYAAQYGHAQIVTLLLNNKANPNVTHINGATPLMFAAGMGHNTIVSQLLQAGADPWIGDFTGRTALTYAKRLDNPATARLLEVAMRHRLDEMTAGPNP